MSEKTPAQAAIAALRQITGYAVGKGLEAGALADIRDIAGKALAAAVNPTAEDYDNAAEILKLRDENTRLQALVRQALEDAGVPEDVQSEWLERAGIEGA